MSYELIPCMCGAVQLDPVRDPITRNGKIIRYVKDGPNKGHHGAGPGAKCTGAAAGGER